MFSKAVKTEKSKSQAGTTRDSDKQNPGKSNTRLTADSPDAASLAAYQAMACNSPQAGQIAQMQAMANGFSAAQAEPKKENNTGLPDTLKTGIENLSGLSMDDVRVHYNSDKPAQLQALAYAQGTEIHVAPGQERHLPHEAWHVVQQMQGRVMPTRQMKGGVQVNDDAGLEKEADIKGAESLNLIIGIENHHLKITNPGKYFTIDAKNKPVLQGQFTPYSFQDQGYPDPEGATTWLEETIGNVVFARSNNMNYTKTDGNNTGSIKHYVPYNWLMKNIADDLVIGSQRDTVIVNLKMELTSLGLGWPDGNPEENRAGFDAWVRDVVYIICDWEENLYKHSISTGDGNGSKLDDPADPVVKARVEAARLRLGTLARPPLL